MKTTENTIILVKYYDSSAGRARWCEYKARKGRDLKKAQYFFSRRKDFRFAIIYEWNKERVSRDDFQLMNHKEKSRIGRGNQVGYFDRNKVLYHN